jgi:hypothetical protein
MVLAVYIAYFLPVLPFAIGWVQVFRSGSEGRAVIAPSVGSASLIWLAAGVLFPAAFGPSYSWIRYGLIHFNFLAAAAATVVSFFSRNPARLFVSV